MKEKVAGKLTAFQIVLIIIGGIGEVINLVYPYYPLLVKFF
ncbi:MAG: hypothetical protein PHN80_12120 [Hespellia sp.]|nr:hypothetical protein [Hespellia sp.]